MSRRSWLLEGITTELRLIEIGASHNPLVPKRDGWNTCVVDHASKEDLARKYSYTQERLQNVEDVDVIWNEGRLHERFTPSDLGRYDAVIASHVVEHLPNPLAFFQSCESLLKPRGRIVLALPDKRRCFDFFGNISTTGDILENYLNARTTHTARTAFNDAAYAVRNGGAIGWGPGQIENLEFVHPFDRAIGVAKRSQRVPAQYFDHHAWRFVPSSFSLIILELQMMGLINLRIVRISDTMTQEFFVEIAGDQLPLPSTEELANRRLALLKENLRSVSLQVQELGE